MKIVTKTPSSKTRLMLESLSKTAAKTLERKRRLGHYAVIWEDGRVILEGEDVPDSAVNMPVSGTESIKC